MKSISGIVVGCVLALALVGCGDSAPRRALCGDLVCELDETAATCAEDCGCGNGIANPGEDCDGTDFADATCESAVQRGGTLGCNADCTFDVTDCDEYMCGNGIAEPGEDCDGSDVAGATCASIGFSAGTVACDSDCRLDVATCCNDFCATANTSVCVDNRVETCVMTVTGCLDLEVADCTVDDDVCDDSSGVASCRCVDRCSTEGAGHCAGAVAETCTMQADGCLAWTMNADCGAMSVACAVGPQGSTCVVAASGEDCNDPYPLTDGQNVIAWTATAADYMTIQPSCGSSTLTGPDIVLAYTATVDGVVTYTMPKELNHRHAIVASNVSCGTLTEISCAGTEFEDLPTMGGTFPVTQGTTYYFYVRDTTLGSGPLPYPLVLDVAEGACSNLTVATSNLSPAQGAVLATTSPVLSFDLQHPANQTTGVITITGDLGTSRSFDLATSPSQVTFTNGGRTIQIDPSVSFLPGETITVSWSGLVDTICGATIAPPTWTFDILTPSCTPGMGGMVGRTIARHATGIPSFTEYYVAADNAATGYVYLGGTSDLYRVPKAGGAFEDVAVDAGISATQLAYSVALVDNTIFTLDTATTSTSTPLWRLSTSGGVTWNPLGYASYPMNAGAGGYSMVHYKGRIYIATNETTTGAATEIYSVSPSVLSLPTVAVLEGIVTGEQDCDGLAIDDHYFYLTCSDSDDRIVRVDRTTLQSELLTGAVDLSTTKNELHADDFDSDGRADVLYIKTDNEVVRYICGPGNAGPFWQDILVDFGGESTTANYGLGFDPVANVLWAYDDDTQELISIQ